MATSLKNVFRVTWGNGYDMIEEIIVANSYEDCLNYLKNDFYKNEDPDMIQLLYTNVHVL